MASNKDLISKIKKMAAELGGECPDLSNAKNSELVEMLASGEEELRRRKAKEMPYTVAKGKSITSKRGILADGAGVTAKDLAGGEEALETLVDAGYVIKA